MVLGDQKTILYQISSKSANKQTFWNFMVIPQSPPEGPPFQNFEKLTSDLVSGDQKTIVHQISSKSVDKQKNDFLGIFGVFFPPKKSPK